MFLAVSMADMPTREAAEDWDEAGPDALARDSAARLVMSIP